MHHHIDRLDERYEDDCIYAIEPLHGLWVVESLIIFLIRRLKNQSG